MKLGRDVPWVKLYESCSRDWIPPITLVAMATKRKKIAVGKIFKNCSQNFDPWKDNAAMGEGDFLYYTNIKKFFKNLLLWNLWSWFWNNFPGMYLGWPFSKIVRKILIHWKTWPSWGMGDFLHYTDMKKFLKNLLLQNGWSEYGIISWDCLLCDPSQKLFARFWSVE